MKYLDFVQVAAIYIIVCFSTVYEYAKEISGPLKPGVQAVEATVKTVLGPVYEDLHDVPFELLEFVDRKVRLQEFFSFSFSFWSGNSIFGHMYCMQVGESLGELERHVPSLVKQASSQARAMASEVQRVGVVDAATTIMNSMYSKYEQVAEQYALSAWRWLNRLPVFPQVAQIVIPTAACWSEKYNQLVRCTEERGYPIATYLPLIPTERIAKVFDEGPTPTVPIDGKIETVSAQ